MKVLSISNSFGVDATTYLHQIARADGVELEVATLHIPACVLERHYRNMLADSRDYTLYFNGSDTGFHISIREALLSRAWDVVVLQQGTAHSPDPQTYQPYGKALADYVRQCVPQAKVFVQQTWAYEQGSALMAARSSYENAEDMFRDIFHAYEIFAADIHADAVIPAGEMFREFLAKGIGPIYRDSLHVTKGLGRYALGLLWYRMLTGNTVAGNSFCDFDEPVDPAYIPTVKTWVDNIKV